MIINLPAVSVVIPAHGHAEYILQTLKSVFDQTYRDYEVIVVDDGSPDDTAQVLAPLVKARRIRYFEQANQGVAAARNFGISHASGKYIALLDDDDLWLPDKLEWQVKLMENSDALAVGGRARFIDANGCIIDSGPGGMWAKNELQKIEQSDCFKECPFISPGQVLIRRQFMDEHLSFDTDMWGADDYDVWLRLSARGIILKSKRPSLLYRLHASNTSRNSERMMWNCSKVLSKHLKLLIGEKRAACRRSGFEWLFEYQGKHLLWRVRTCLLTRKPRVLKAVALFFLLLRSFAPALVYDRSFRSRFIGELKTAFWRDIWDPRVNR